MLWRIVTAALLAAAVWPSTTTAAPPSDLASLSLEVEALRVMYYFEMTPEQMSLLQGMAKETAQPAVARPANASAKYRKLLSETYEVMVQGTDEDRMDELLEQLDDLGDEEDPDISDTIEITDASRKRVADVLRKLSAPQVAGFLANMSWDVDDPAEFLIETIVDAHHVLAKNWKVRREELAGEATWRLAGLDATKSASMRGKVLALLEKTRGIKDPQFRSLRPELEKEARQLAGEVGALQAVGYYVDHSLALLLSNPRLEAAINARLKK